MAIYYSKYFGIPHTLFEQKGVFDGFIDRDSKFHIDPLRLRDIDIPEFDDAYNDVFLEYFNRFVIFVDGMTETNQEMMFNLVIEHLQFSEIPNVGLGYSTKGKPGKGMSGKIARQVATSIVEIIKAGMKEPELFAFMHLFEKNIGADRISDMTIYILRSQILKYTERVASELGIVPIYSYNYNGNSYSVPYYDGKPLHLLPTSLLANLPLATSFEEISNVCDYNRGLIAKVCNAVNGNLKDFIEGTNKKGVLKNALLNNKKAYQDVIEYIRGLKTLPYDFNKDEQNIYFEARLNEYIAEKLNERGCLNKLSAEDVLVSTREACMLFKECIENHRSYKLMYYEKGKLAKSEKIAQELLFLVAEAYLKAKGADIDISPEADTGVGKLDFKFSQGTDSRVIIETKLSNNADLLHGYVTQLPDYMKSQKTNYGLYIVVIVDSSKNQNSQIQKLKEIESARDTNNITKPEIIFVNACERPTASKK